MSKILFDVDASTASLGTQAMVTELCGGIEPFNVFTEGIDVVMKTLNDLFLAETVTRKHPIIASSDISETIIRLSPLAQKYAIDCLMIDTYSHLQRNDMRLLEQKRPTLQMEISDWGTLERKYNMSLNLIKRLPIPAVVNCHSTLDKDNQQNFFINAALKGKAGEFINEYFDVVLYTQAVKDKHGNQVFSWFTKPDGMRKAKDRLNLLPAIMPQDFSVILDQYKKAGYPAVKILVIGESGTGKTRALATLPKTILP